MINRARQNDACHVIEKSIITIENKKQSLIQKYSNKLNREVKEIMLEEIKRFYDSYDPIQYVRNHDLYNTFKIDIRDGKISIDIDESYMKFDHNDDNEYVFFNSIMEGYHGGARYGDGHPSPGTPYWKLPPTFEEWGRPAKRSVSPYKMINYRVRKKIKDTEIEMQKEYDKTMAEIISTIRKSIIKIRHS